MADRVRITPAPKLGGRAGPLLRFLSVSRGESVLTDIEEGSRTLERKIRGLPVMHRVWFGDSEAACLGYRGARVGQPSDLYFLNEHGGIERHTRLPNVVSAAAWVPVGWIVGCRDGSLYGYSTDGTLLWKEVLPLQLLVDPIFGPFAPQIAPSPRVAAGGGMIAAGEGSQLTALNTVGHRQWRAPLPSGRASRSQSLKPAQLPTREEALSRLGAGNRHKAGCGLGYIRWELGMTSAARPSRSIEMYDLEEDMCDRAHNPGNDEKGEQEFEVRLGIGSQGTAISALGVSGTSIAAGTTDGLVHILDFQGSLLRTFRVSRAPVAELVTNHRELKACYAAGMLTQFRGERVTGSVKLPEYFAELVQCGDHVLAWRWKSAWLVNRSGRVVWKGESSHRIRAAIGEPCGFGLLAGSMPRLRQRPDGPRSAFGHFNDFLFVSLFRAATLTAVRTAPDRLSSSRRKNCTAGGTPAARRPATSCSPSAKTTPERFSGPNQDNMNWRREGHAVKRRIFVGGMFAGLATPRPARPKSGDIPMRTLGRTGQKLTIIGQGGARMGMAPFEEMKAVVRRAYDLGINYFDMARTYANSRAEDVYGAVIPDFRKDIFLTSKSLQRTRAGAEKELETSLRTMKTDYLDLWQIHMVSRMQEVEQIFAPGGAMEAFEAAKKSGKCRFIGYTGCRDPEIHVEMLKHADRFDTCLMPLHIAMTLASRIRRK